MFSRNATQLTYVSPAFVSSLGTACQRRLGTIQMREQILYVTSRIRSGQL